MDPLTPEEMALKAEGEELLKKITGSKGSVVGPDGMPLKEPEDPNAPKEEGKKPLSEEEAKEVARKAIDDRVAKLREANIKERDEALVTMSKVCKENTVARQCMQVMLHAHRLVAWAKLEMQTLDKRVDDKSLMHLERQVHGAVYKSGDFNSQDLAKDVRSQVCKFLDERNRVYADQMRKRKAQISKTLRQLPKEGFALPCKYLKDLRDKHLKGVFGPGDLLVLYGKRPAVSASLRVFGMLHSKEIQGEGHHFIMEETAPPTYDDRIVMTVSSWWRNALSSICQFYDTLYPVVDSSSTMLLVEDMNALLLASADQMAVGERKSRVLTALRQWAVEHAVAVVVGDPMEEDPDQPLKYGGVACAAVRIERKDDVAKLFIGDDEEVDVKDLKLEAD